MIKHLGRHNNKKVVILYREVPDEVHMCLVVYPETLPLHTQEVVMKALESPTGQASKSFSDVLFRTSFTDGRNALSTLHSEGNIKKINSSQVIVTPNSTSSIRLDELNDILREMEKGEDAIRKLKELDESAGMGSGTRKKMKDLGDAHPPANSVTNVPDSHYTGTDMKAAVDAFKTTSSDLSFDAEGTEYNGLGVLSDADLAKQRLAQAEAIKVQMQNLLAEATRLESEAKELDPSLAADKPVKKSGRPKKAV